MYQPDTGVIVIVVVNVNEHKKIVVTLYILQATREKGNESADQQNDGRRGCVGRESNCLSLCRIKCDYRHMQDI
jgi:hypothetical protein